MGMLSDILPDHLAEKERIAYLMEKCDEILDGYNIEQTGLTASGSPAWQHTGTFTTTPITTTVEIGYYNADGDWVVLATDKATAGVLVGDLVESGTVTLETGAVVIGFASHSGLSSFTMYARRHVEGILEDLRGFGDFFSIENSPYKNKLIELLGLKLRFTLEETWDDEAALVRYLKGLYHVLSAKGTERAFKMIVYFLKLYQKITIYPLYTDDYVDFTAKEPLAADTWPDGDWFHTPHFRVVVPDTVYTELGDGSVGTGIKVWKEIFNHLYNVKPAHTVMTYGIIVNIWKDDDDTPIDLHVDGVMNYGMILDMEASATMPELTGRLLVSQCDIKSGGDTPIGEYGIWDVLYGGSPANYLIDSQEHVGPSGGARMSPGVELADGDVVYAAYRNVMVGALQEDRSYNFTTRGWTGLNSQPEGLVEVADERILLYRRTGNIYIAISDDKFATDPGNGVNLGAAPGFHCKPTFAHDGNGVILVAGAWTRPYRSADNGDSWAALDAVFTPSGNIVTVHYYDGSFYAVGIGHDGSQWRIMVWESTDGGQNFTVTGTLTTVISTARHIRSIVVGDSIYIAFSNTDPNTYLYKYDHDDTWSLGATWAADYLWGTAPAPFNYVYPVFEYALGKFWIGIYDSGTTDFDLYWSATYSGTFVKWGESDTIIDGLIGVYQ